MIPLAGLMPGIPEMLIILAVVLLLFGGSRLAGLGKSTGRAIKEFKDETKGLKGAEKPEAPLEPPAVGQGPGTPTAGTPYQQPTFQQPPPANGSNPADTDLRKDV